jgi:hypothetical protein
MDEAMLPGDFTILPARQIRTSAFTDASKKIVKLELTEPLQPGVTYQLLVSNVLDCNQNVIHPTKVNFGLPEMPEPGDLLVNEILFNPRAGGSDFVEFYNTSNKFISTSELKLGNLENDAPVHIRAVSAHQLVSPGTYVVFTDDPSIVQTHYPLSRGKNIYYADLPGLPDDEGSIMLLNGVGKVIDAVTYSRHWHSPFIQDESGVSLERISWRTSTQTGDNWISSGSADGFATPGYVNTQHRGENLTSPGEVIVTPELFSPGMDQNGFVEIRYQFDQPGMMVNVTVLDPKGHHLKTIADSEWVGSEGFFRWDGEADNGQLVRWGYYLVLFEAFNGKGDVNIFRKRVIVASR